MEADLTLEELNCTIKSRAMKDAGPGPDGIPFRDLQFLPTIPLLGGGISPRNGINGITRIVLKK